MASVLVIAQEQSRVGDAVVNAGRFLCFLECVHVFLFGFFGYLLRVTNATRAARIKARMIGAIRSKARRNLTRRLWLAIMVCMLVYVKGLLYLRAFRLFVPNGLNCRAIRKRCFCKWSFGHCALWKGFFCVLLRVLVLGRYSKRILGSVSVCCIGTWFWGVVG